MSFFAYFQKDNPQQNIAHFVAGDIIYLKNDFIYLIYLKNFEFELNENNFFENFLKILQVHRGICTLKKILDAPNSFSM